MPRNHRIRGVIVALTLAICCGGRSAATQSVHELHVTVSKFQYEPNTIQVTAGEPVRLVLRSKDSVHGFSIATLKIAATIPKGGEPVTIEFVAPPPGRYDIACDEFCGSGHGQMKASLISVAATRSSRF